MHSKFLLFLFREDANFPSTFKRESKAMHRHHHHHQCIACLSFNQMVAFALWILCVSLGGIAILQVQRFQRSVSRMTNDVQNGYIIDRLYSEADFEYSTDKCVMVDILCLPTMAVAETISNDRFFSGIVLCISRSHTLVSGSNISSTFLYQKSCNNSLVNIFLFRNLQTNVKCII